MFRKENKLRKLIRNTESNMRKKDIEKSSTIIKKIKRKYDALLAPTIDKTLENFKPNVQDCKVGGMTPEEYWGFCRKYGKSRTDVLSEIRF